MRILKWVLPLALAGLAGCVAYPTNYGYGYGYREPAATVYVQPGYYGAPPPVYRGRPLRDRDRDGVPDRYDRDRDGDGTPNRYDPRPDQPRRR